MNLVIVDARRCILALEFLVTCYFHDHQDDSLLRTKEKPKNTPLWVLNWLFAAYIFEYD